jgi:hypothetical protein
MKITRPCVRDKSLDDGWVPRRLLPLGRPNEHDGRGGSPGVIVWFAHVVETASDRVEVPLTGAELEAFARREGFGIGWDRPGPSTAAEDQSSNGVPQLNRDALVGAVVVALLVASPRLEEANSGMGTGPTGSGRLIGGPGPSNWQILEHCRSRTHHVRGRWVLDMLLGKE